MGQIRKAIAQLLRQETHVNSAEASSQAAGRVRTAPDSFEYMQISHFAQNDNPFCPHAI